MALPPNVLNSARQLMSQTSNYRGAPVQTGATKPNLAQTYSAAGGTLPKGIEAGTPAGDAYMKPRLRYVPGVGWQSQDAWNAANLTPRVYNNQPAPSAPVAVPPPAPVPVAAPTPAPAPTQTPGIQWTPEDMERELQRIRSEGITWNSGNRLPYMQTLFDRLRSEQMQYRLQPRVNPVTRF